MIIRIKLYKSVVTDRKVSFIEQQSFSDMQSKRHPVTLTISKQEWLDNGRPETLEVTTT